jgi:hypothetical protein
MYFVTLAHVLLMSCSCLAPVSSLRRICLINRNLLTSFASQSYPWSHRTVGLLRLFTDYLTVSDEAFPHGIQQTVKALAERGLSLGLHMHPDIVWPCSDTETLECLTTGVGISPVVEECPGEQGFGLTHLYLHARKNSTISLSFSFYLHAR